MSLRAAEKRAALPGLPRSRGSEPREVSMSRNSTGDAGIRLRRVPAHGYDSGPPSAKEASREGARPVPLRESVLRHPWRHLRRASARILEGRRHSRSQAVAREDHRRGWGGRPSHHARRLSERAHPYGCERADHPRAARHLLGQLSAALALAGFLAGCDDGPRVLEENHGPALRVVSTFPEDGAGFDCPLGDLACGVPVDTAIQIRFDRYLLPSTATRQSFFLYSGEPSN